MTEYDPNNPAHRIASMVAGKYELSYAMKVNLEAISNKLLPKLTEEETIDVLDDLVECMLDEFCRWEALIYEGD